VESSQSTKSQFSVHLVIGPFFDAALQLAVALRTGATSNCRLSGATQTAYTSDGCGLILCHRPGQSNDSPARIAARKSRTMPADQAAIDNRTALFSVLFHPARRLLAFRARQILMPVREKRDWSGISWPNHKSVASSAAAGLLHGALALDRPPCNTTTLSQQLPLLRSFWVRHEDNPGAILGNDSSPRILTTTHRLHRESGGIRLVSSSKRATPFCERIRRAQRAIADFPLRCRSPR
jgi:hypothetical protein